MEYIDFIASLADDKPPDAGHVALRALWYDANGREESAARAIRNDSSYPSLRVCAYLARKSGVENDILKGYWKCGVDRWQGSFESEWEDIVRTILVQIVVERSYL